MSDKMIALDAFKRLFPEYFDEAINSGSEGHKLIFTLTNSRRVIFDYIDDDNYTMEMKEID